MGTSAPVPWQPDPDKAPRLWPAWQAMLNHLGDGEWHPRIATLDVMLRASDITPKACSGLIATAAKAGLVDRRRNGKHHQDRLTPTTDQEA